jgi:hypothetical protein
MKIWNGDPGPWSLVQKSELFVTTSVFGKKLRSIGGLYAP